MRSDIFRALELLMAHAAMAVHAIDAGSQAWRHAAAPISRANATAGTPPAGDDAPDVLHAQQARRSAGENAR